MNTVLWVCQILLALVMGMAGWLKVSRPKSDMEPRMTWVQDYPQSTIRVIGLLELAAAVGLVLPAASGLVPVLTPLAAGGVALLMVLAMLVHARRRESQFLIVNAIVLALAVFIFWGRIGPYAI